MLRLRSQSPGLAFNDLGIEIASARCYHCGELAGVSARAMTARCEHCGKNLDIPDVRIKGHHWGGVLVTCGRVSIGRRAEVTCTRPASSTRARTWSGKAVKKTMLSASKRNRTATVLSRTLSASPPL